MRVCDVGLGKGIVFEALRAAGAASLVGVDIANAVSGPFRRLRRSAGRARPTQRTCPSADAFDVVIATDILEHVVNVGDFMLSVRDSLVPRGRLLVRVPYKDDMLQYARLNSCQLQMVHLRNFADDDLTDLLRRAGFVA